MLVADDYLGSLDDPDVADRVAAADSLRVTVDDTERRRSRVRTTAADGTDLGIVVDRELRDGDVLDADGRPVVVSLEPVEAMTLEFAGVGGDAGGVAVAALALGHAVGNRHWDLALEGTRAYLPVTEDRDRMAAAVGPHLPDGVTVDYESVPPATFDDSGPDHSHGDPEHAHGHDGVGHDHSGADHAHGHSGADHDHSHGHESAVRPLDPDDGGTGASADDGGEQS